MRPALFFALAVVGLGCSSKHEDRAASSNTLSFDFSAHVEAGTEIQVCKYIRMPTTESAYAVNRTSHEYSAGSHHFLVYRTDLDEIPAGGDEFTDCNEAGWMSKVRGVVYGAQTTDGEFVMPQGVAQRFRPGEVMMVQAHYLNATPNSLDAAMHFHMQLVDPATATEEAGVLFFFNPAIVVPASGTSSAELRCPLPADATLGFAVSHMHKRGVGYLATTDDSAASSALGPLYETQKWDEPIPRVFPLDPPARIAAGSSISYRCDYQNTDPATVVAGTSAETDEMCMFVGMYWPRQSADAEFCKDGVVPSTGTASALDTLGCLVKCGGTAEADCVAGCWQNACPAAPEALFAFTRCAGTACSPSCFLDPTGQACADCAKPDCADDYARLLGSNCGN
jgi:Copper type II ascorbate-dependent monooxygenase, C-terminal domain